MCSSRKRRGSTNKEWLTLAYLIVMWNNGRYRDWENIKSDTYYTLTDGVAVEVNE